MLGIRFGSTVPKDCTVNFGYKGCDYKGCDYKGFSLIRDGFKWSQSFSI